MPKLSELAELRSGNRETWHYNISWKSRGFGGRLGAAHFVDVPFSFYALTLGQAKASIGDAPPPSLAEAMHSAWASFAKTGDPGWQVYDLTTVADPEKATRTLWKDIVF
ncbi:hypothetical protein PY650_15100 [Rhizobium calliandrae]|uniref:Carboxylesterase type B domain-containing protein n=1 Tax=Rhizobium calliandrae TaxID=1312182 RepID=A0ABT7KEB2_9HYPH|nr:hypothetical protein [Rhizobium calliandrae]MDL2406966.1 hypothetical protein [Rhizobium calliandrae]